MSELTVTMLADRFSTGHMKVMVGDLEGYAVEMQRVWPANRPSVEGVVEIVVTFPGYVENDGHRTYKDVRLKGEQLELVDDVVCMKRPTVIPPRAKPSN